MHMLASHLHRSVAELEATMSAAEFSRWIIWMHAEQLGPHWTRVHRAEALAAACNAGQVSHRDRRAFSAVDFLQPDPWEQRAAVPAIMSADALRAMHDAHLQAEEAWLDATLH